MNSIITNILVSVATAVAVVVWALSMGFTPQVSLAGNPLQAPYSLTATGTPAVVVNAQVPADQILATTTGDNARMYVSICNPSTNIVYLAFQADAFTNSSSSIPIGQGTAGIDACYEITDRNMYFGAIRASSTNAAASLSVIQFSR